MYVRIYVCIYVRMYVFMYVRIYVCMYVDRDRYDFIHPNGMQ